MRGLEGGQGPEGPSRGRDGAAFRESSTGCRLDCSQASLSLGSPRKRALTPTLLSRAKTPVGSGSSGGTTPVAGASLLSLGALQLPDEVRLLPAEELGEQLQIAEEEVVIARGNVEEMQLLVSQAMGSLSTLSRVCDFSNFEDQTSFDYEDFEVGQHPIAPSHILPLLQPSPSEQAWIVDRSCLPAWMPNCLPACLPGCLPGCLRVLGNGWP